MVPGIACLTRRPRHCRFQFVQEFYARDRVSAVRRRDIAIQIQAQAYQEELQRVADEEAASIARLKRMVDKVSQWEVMMTSRDNAHAGAKVCCVRGLSLCLCRSLPAAVAVAVAMWLR